MERARIAPLVGLALAALLAACADPGTPYVVKVADRAMEPTFPILTPVPVRPVGTIRRGEVVVFEYPFERPRLPPHYLLSRVIGLPDDVVELRAGQVVVNGQVLEEPYVRHQRPDTRPPFTVPPGHLFVLGDDRTNQRDSRFWGPLPRRKVVGVVRCLDAAEVVVNPYVSCDDAVEMAEWGAEAGGRPLRWIDIPFLDIRIPLPYQRRPS